MTYEIDAVQGDVLVLPVPDLQEAQRVAEEYAAKLRPSRVLRWEKFRAKVRKKMGLPKLPMTSSAKKILARKTTGGAS